MSIHFFVPPWNSFNAFKYFMFPRFMLIRFHTLFLCNHSHQHIYYFDVCIHLVAIVYFVVRIECCFFLFIVIFSGGEQLNDNLGYFCSSFLWLPRLICWIAWILCKYIVHHMFQMKKNKIFRCSSISDKWNEQKYSIQPTFNHYIVVNCVCCFLHWMWMWLFFFNFSVLFVNFALFKRLLCVDLFKVHY